MKPSIVAKSLPWRRHGRSSMITAVDCLQCPQASLLLLIESWGPLGGANSFIPLLGCLRSFFCYIPVLGCSPLSLGWFLRSSVLGIQGGPEVVLPVVVVVGGCLVFGQLGSILAVVSWALFWVVGSSLYFPAASWFCVLRLFLCRTLFWRGVFSI